MQNILCGLACLALAVAYYFIADGLPRSLLSDPTGADGMPKLLATVLAILSVVLIVVGFARRAQAEPDDARTMGRHLRSAGMLALGVVYFLALPWLGYPVAVFLFLLAVTLYAGIRFGITPIAVSAAGAAVLWISFVYLLHVPMPGGVWLPG